MTLLRVDHLDLSIGNKPVLSDIGFKVAPGEIVGLVGESGSGKSLTALSILGLLPQGSALTGTIDFEGRELAGLGDRELAKLRGGRIGMIFQEPMTALNPLMTIGDQVAETVQLHEGLGRRKARLVAEQALERVGLPSAAVPASRYPHELSGGQRQRVGIAIAVAARPELLIADEPTTALDVTTQADVLALLQRLVREHGMGMILITHDLAVVSGMAQSVVVMQEGRVVEAGTTAQVLERPRHAYTKALLAATVHVPERKRQPLGDVLLEVRDVTRVYRQRPLLPFSPRRELRAVDGVNFTVRRGESVGLVGESGSGKSTLARAIVGLDPAQGGTVTLDGMTVRSAGRAALASLRDMQMVFQDPYGSFDPRHTVRRLVAEPLHLLGSDAPQGEARERRVRAALDSVGLEASMADRYIHQFSGGQRQRIAIARALIVEPALIVLDEAVSALDVSVRAQILDLLADLADRRGLSYLFISHDLGVVRAITDRVLVMKNGAIVEEGRTEQVLSHPRHPYTRTLIAATPRLKLWGA